MIIIFILYNKHATTNRIKNHFITTKSITSLELFVDRALQKLNNMAATVDLGRQLQLENGAYLTFVLKKKSSEIHAAG